MVMKKILILLLLSLTYIFANVNAIVSILPEQTFVKAIGGDKVNVSLMVRPGNSPHTYEPKPSQMMDISKADLYFSIGVEFENVWLPKFENLNSKMKVIDITKGIKKQPMQQDHHNCTAHGAHDHSSESLDPHSWTSPMNVKIMAQNIYKVLVNIDSENKNYYKTNLKVFLASIEDTDIKIKSLLSDYNSSRTFMVFHPSWGYFAKAYYLEQIAVELEGKSTNPREIVPTCLMQIQID
jgi:zinc transport system substrate-binding protein